MNFLYINRLSNLYKYTKYVSSTRKYKNKSTNYENVINLNESTLTGRLLLYLSNDIKQFIPKIAPASNIQLKSNIYPTNLERLDLNELENVFMDINTLKNLEIKDKLKLVDAECCSRINDMNTTRILRFLNIYMHIIPHRIIEYNFYKLAISNLNEYVDFLTKQELMQLFFYVGLQKKNKTAQVILRKCLKNININDLSIEDLCIICNSTFKTSTKISNRYLLDKISETLNDNLYLLKDPALFITFVKSLRHNRCQDDDIISTISCTILFNSTFQYYSFGAICHILALYADYLYYDDAILKLFNEKCLQLLSKSEVTPNRAYVTEQIRTKDIKRFLWIYSNLGYALDQRIFKDVIVPKIIDRIKNGNYDNDPESLLDSFLYMWMLKYQAIELVPYCFTVKNIQAIRETKSKSKHRLNLLLTCIQLENLQLYKEINFRPVGQQHIDINQQVLKRPALNRVYNVLKELSIELSINKFEFETQIPHLNIVGITGYTKNIYKTVFIEVLDDFFCVRNRKDSFAIGPMQLKLRLLDNMDPGLIIIESNEIVEMTDTELKDYLEAEIKFVT